ncbi:Valyl-tRNA synthetase [Spraguea lophii 42_110]|uniref:Probable valine--tRNA ligase, cytoplasmic n=1 Tax=Spraguea lophii (strain 42_110) TaxID=1358809 RepID=S7WDL5_SPRLO|nr:Valyl-tRNA synthetase [Spraguea lophii 42_110]
MDRKASKEEKKRLKMEKFMNKKLQTVTVSEKKKKKIEIPVIEDKTIPGQRKILDICPNSFIPSYVESSWYQWWEEKGYFKPETLEEYQKVKDPYVIPIPPPNVTGKLHIGHSMMIAIQDSIARYKRMKGHPVLYIPGTDHAGIATQTVVEKKLYKEKNLKKEDLGREKFLKSVWEWKELYGNSILEQIKRMGTSVDFSRLSFTLNDMVSSAVVEAFNRFYEKGLIYRDKKLVNWCSKLKTTLSDLEVNHVILKSYEDYLVDGKKYKFGIIYAFYYKVGDEKIEVETTRPETILGDSGLCINPNDKRYMHLKGKYAINPITEEQVPIIFDEYAQMDFGSGIVKLTPAHDFNDFELGKKHKLKMIRVIDDNNKMTVGKYKGMNRFDCREEIIKDLTAKGLFVEKRKYEQTLPICSRSGDIVEPVMKDQWWMNCNEMARKALEVVESGEIELLPVEAFKTWKNWLINIRDWCLSRQLWWGHRIPAYKIESGNETEWIVARSMQEARDQADKKYKEYTINQDEDVLDTWFSSGLWPFAILGWPEETDDYKKYFPTSILETGSDILFFWVARMVMMSLELTGKIPFKQILLHGIVRDTHGRKMSKSLGNVIDPIFVIEGISLKGLNESIMTNLDKDEIKKAIEGQKKEYPNGIPQCGADALRFALCSHTSGIKDINLDVLRVEGYRRFCNKIWNSFKFVEKMIKDAGIEKIEDCDSNEEFIYWILNQRNETIKKIETCFNSFNFLLATQTIHNFILYSFCDIFIEIVKRKNTKENISILFNIFLDILRMIHPFMPFISEEIFQRLKIYKNDLCESICVDKYPEVIETKSDNFDIVIKVGKAIRSIIDGNKLRNVIFTTNNKEVIENIEFILILCKQVKEYKMVTNVNAEYIEEVDGFKIGIDQK